MPLVFLLLSIGCVVYLSVKTLGSPPPPPPPPPDGGSAP